jgi:multidrug efflux system outer membrane protein
MWATTQRLKDRALSAALSAYHSAYLSAPLFTSLAASLVTAVALNGCATPKFSVPHATLAPEAKTMPQLASSTTATTRAPAVLAIDRWWTSFNDVQLNGLMDEALARNEDLEAAAARVREAQANLDATRAAWWPTLDAKFQNGRSQQSQVGGTPLPPGLDRRATSHTAQLTTSYEVDLWGRLASSTAAARSDLLATEWARAGLQWSLTARLAEAYFGLIAADRQIEISVAVRAGRQATLDLRQREQRAGTGNEFDVRRAEAELIAAESTLASLARQRIALEHALTGLLGRSPAEIASGALPRARLDESQAAQAQLPEGAAAQLLARRPDVRQAEAQLAAANSGIDAARAATLPALRLTGSIGSDARKIADLFSGPAFIWSIAASATQAIVDGGKNDARVRAEQARAAQALANYRKAIAAAVLDLREAYATLDVTHEAFRAEQARAAALARARELAQVGRDAGVLNNIDLLDAERNLYQAQLQQVTAYHDQRVAQVAAFKALGGGYTSVATSANAATSATLAASATSANAAASANAANSANPEHHASAQR